MNPRRELLQDLGSSFALLKAAHASVQAALRLGTPDAVQCAAVRQWAYAIQSYTRCLEQLIEKPAPPEPIYEANSPDAVDRVRKGVLGRIQAGRFIRP
jgi:hypothetical protein